MTHPRPPALGKLLRALALGCLTSTAAHAVEIAPDHPSLSPDLQLWLSAPATTFDGATWTDNSQAGNDLVQAVDAIYEMPLRVAAGAPAAGTADVLTATSGAYNGLTFDTVAFDSTLHDLMVAPDLNGDVGSSDWTLFVVYATDTNHAGDRPAGLGFYVDTSTADNMQMASDGTIRFDGGVSEVGSAIPSSTGQPFLRTIRLDNQSVSQWYDGAIDFADAANAGSPMPVADDDFYLGDLRRGDTISSDHHIIAVLAYNDALTDTEVDGINEYLLADPTRRPLEPQASDIPFMGPLGLGLMMMGLAGAGVSTLREEEEEEEV